MGWFGSFKTISFQAHQRQNKPGFPYCQVEMPEQNTIINQPLPACKDEKLMVLFLTVLFQIKHPRDQNFPLKSRVMDMLPKNPNTTEQNAAFPGGKAPELWISWLVGQGRQHLRAG